MAIAGMRPRDLAVLAVMPVLFVVAVLLMREHGGPYWVWHVIDPSYFYLFDSLHIATLHWPGHPYHPGTPVQVIGAAVLRLLHPLLSNDALVQTVLDRPEAYLHRIGDVIIALQALALFAAGAVAWAVTRSLGLAVVMETGPFLTMVVLKNAYHVKPEPVLTLTMLLFSIVTLLALRPGALDGNGRYRYAAVWGLVAGFGVATKLTAAPVFVLPVFLLGGWRPVLAYGAASLAGFGFFILPAAGTFYKFLSFVAVVTKGSGAYGTGAQTVIDVAQYPKALFKILKRTAAALPVLIALAALGTAAWRSRRGRSVPSLELRALAGIGLAVFLQAMAVAKQPTANYMVPSYMLLPLAVVVGWRFWAGLNAGAGRFGVWAKRVAAVAGIVVLALQAKHVFDQDRELDARRRAALTPNDVLFDQCARIYFFPSSSPTFALQMGDWWSGSLFPDAVAARIPANQFWFEQNTMALRDAKGVRSLPEVAKAFPCLMLRGGHMGPIGAFLAEKLPDMRFESACSTPDEFVLTAVGACARVRAR